MMGKFIWHTAVALMVIAITTMLLARVLPANATTAGFAYLLVVLGVSTAWGLASAVVTAVAATLCFNFYFLPPVGQFTISDPENWIALFAFLATALIASQLSDRAKNQALEAQARQRETEQLYTLSRTILLAERSAPLGPQAAQHIAEIFACPAVALYDAATGEVSRGGAEDLPGIEPSLKQVLIDGQGGNVAGVTVTAIVLGGRPIGSLAMKGPALSDGALKALLNLVAIALERVHVEEGARRAEASRASQEFKSTLLDAIAHEFNTPLTSIKAASTSMLGDELSPHFRELATIIDEESDRLTTLVNEAVRMSQIDAGKFRIERVLTDPDELVRAVLNTFAARAEDRKLVLHSSGNLPQVPVDRELLELALRQLIDNALKYSPQGSPVDVFTGVENGRVTIRIHDEGPGVPERERDRVFDRFYRQDGVKARIPGTGMGLYIAREIVRAHAGDVWIEPNGANVALPLLNMSPNEARA